MNNPYPYRNPQHQQTDFERQELDDATQYPGRHGNQGGHMPGAPGNDAPAHGSWRPDMAPGHDYPEQVWHPHHESNPRYDQNPDMYGRTVNRDRNPRGPQEYGGNHASHDSSYSRDRRFQEYGSSGQGGYGGDFQGRWAGREPAGNRSSPYGGSEYEQHQQRGAYGGMQSGQGSGSPWSGAATPGGQPGYRGTQSGNRARGPKGYTRSDERIKEDICERLMAHPYADASDVTIEVKEGIVTLEGTVEARHIKHEIENVAESCMGVKDIENHVRVSQGSGATTGNRGSESPDRNEHFDPHARGAGVP